MRSFPIRVMNTDEALGGTISLDERLVDQVEAHQAINLSLEFIFDTSMNKLRLMGFTYIPDQAIPSEPTQSVVEDVNLFEEKKEPCPGCGIMPGYSHYRSCTTKVGEIWFG